MTDLSTQPPVSPVPEIPRVPLKVLGQVLKAGWADFWAAPLFGMFFSVFYVIGGWIMLSILYQAGQMWWALYLVVGFPLVAPFAAVGLYEVSRQLGQGKRPKWRSVLGVVLAERNRQVPWIGALILFWFMFWVFIAHSIFALIMGLSALTNISNSLESLMSTQGLILLLVELGIGSFFAFVAYTITAISLPLLLDREIDFVTAMIISTQTVLKNLPVMVTWAVIIAVLMFIGMVLGFIGLFIVLPVLGHATWHLYQRLFV